MEQAARWPSGREGLAWGLLVQALNRLVSLHRSFAQESSVEQPEEDEEGVDMDVLLQEDIREAGVRMRVIPALARPRFLG